MDQKSLQDMFSEYLEKTSIFKNKNALSLQFQPEEIQHRQNQINELAGILTPALRQINPSNIFIYGSVGTGKTLTVNHVAEELQKTAQSHNVNIKLLYLNCKMKKVADTEYRVLSQLARELGETVPSTGLPTEDVYNRFFQKLDEEYSQIIIMLDEVDALYKKIGDNFLYTLTRMNEQLVNAQVSMIGISNDLNFTQYMDSRVKSSLSEEEIIFPPYNAFELVDILQERAQLAFTEGVIQDGVIQMCAAVAAQDHGDARRALDLLKVAGELAERAQKEEITTEDVEAAQEKIEKDKTFEAVTAQTKQKQLLVYAILDLYQEYGTMLSTGDVYKKYTDLCKKTGMSHLTSRRVSDLISELDMLGIITTSVISKGRYGRTRHITLNISDEIVEKIEQHLKERFYL